MASKKASGAETFAPLEQAYMLLNGRHVRFLMPDMFAFASGRVDMPNSAQAAIYRLIFTGVETPPPEKQFIYDQQWTRSMFYVAQLCIAPRVRLEPGEEGEIDVRELSIADLLACFSFFRYGPPLPLSFAADTHVDAGAAVAPTGDDVSPLAE